MKTPDTTTPDQTIGFVRIIVYHCAVCGVEVDGFGACERHPAANVHSIAVGGSAPTVAPGVEIVADIKPARVGHAQANALRLLAIADPAPVKRYNLASCVGPHGSLQFGYATISRLIARGLVMVEKAEGERGASLRLTELGRVTAAALRGGK